MRKLVFSRVKSFEDHFLLAESASNHSIVLFIMQIIERFHHLHGVDGSNTIDFVSAILHGNANSGLLY